MNKKELIAALNKVDSDQVHIMLDASDYGEVAGIVKQRGKYYLCTEFELTKLAPSEIITGKTNIDKSEKTE